MRTSKLLTIPALLMALLLALCGCEIDLTGLVTDIILVASKEASSGGTAEVSSVEETPSSQPPEESQATDTTTSDTTAEPSELPEPEPIPEPVPEPNESEPISSVYIPLSSKPASSKAPVSSKVVSSVTASRPVIPPNPQPAPTPMYEGFFRTDFWGLMRLFTYWEAEEINAIGALMPFMLAKGNYRGTYTAPEDMADILQLAKELAYDETVVIQMHTVDWRELEPVQLCADIGGKLYYCRTVYAQRVEDVCYLYEYTGGLNYVRYRISEAAQTDVSSEISDTSSME